jgi:hypothetical protein
MKQHKPRCRVQLLRLISPAIAAFNCASSLLGILCVADS